jgi:ZIP family zinc transporter
MIAASYWSLLAPGIEMAEQQGVTPWIPAVIGFLLGGAFMRLVDMTLPHMHMFTEIVEGPESTWRRSLLLVSAMTIHNIPEGLAVGVAFGAASLGLETASIAGASALAIGIGLQNFPEGIAVSMPLRREGMSPLRCFGWGQFSGMVEPIAAVIGAATVLLVRPLLPYALSFAAGAMIFVVAEELIPESQEAGNVDLATGGVMLGFAVMMTLDVALG